MLRCILIASTDRGQFFAGSKKSRIEKRFSGSKKMCCMKRIGKKEEGRKERRKEGKKEGRKEGKKEGGKKEGRKEEGRIII